jgi:hypothetical protein
VDRATGNTHWAKVLDDVSSDEPRSTWFKFVNGHVTMRPHSLGAQPDTELQSGDRVWPIRRMSGTSFFWSLLGRVSIN